ncbi:hypothetical protein ACFIQG_20530 [Comamonas odontotermitis]|uniref:hypothetical protein n=1 Tax=Comamonas odontotermitis TaxID=379895 RepID=UPI00366DF619
MSDINYPYVIQKRISVNLQEEIWQTISELLDYETAKQLLSEAEITPDGNFRILFDAPDLMHLNAICRETHYVAV